jgi:hypothetical protein
LTRVSCCSALGHASRRRTITVIRVASIRGVIPALCNRTLCQAGLALGQGVALRIVPNARRIRPRWVGVVAGLIQVVSAGALRAEIRTNARRTAIRQPIGVGALRLIHSRRIITLDRVVVWAADIRAGAAGGALSHAIRRYTCTA